MARALSHGLLVAAPEDVALPVTDGVALGVGVAVGVGDADGDEVGLAVGDAELEGDCDGLAVWLGAELPWAGPTRFGVCAG